MRTPSGETIVVLGASSKPFRYSYAAVKELAGNGYHVVAIGSTSGMIGDVEIFGSMSPDTKAHTATFYLSPGHQDMYERWLTGGNVKRIIFNPGTENIPLRKKLEEAGVEVIWGCTLVMLSTGGF
ncbi:MAG: CoA-binding protein [Bacteroidetes bacterium HGW-Bacteroidetes-22]|nr:MAG: CoA-binding protein [Bacteroidetes bacterium HGW-Bacteroidetes-22]